jgi:peptidoglycan L-alanyl-D-glutamate endopeptidase CwlK
MPSFGNTSTIRLNGCHNDLRRLFLEVVRKYDCSVLCGHRNEEDQHTAYITKRSKLDWDKSKHNSNPSTAIDVAPYPIDWEDLNRFYHFAGYVLATADEMDIKVRWGGDWDSDKTFKDQNFNDLPHWELLQQ